MQAKNILTGVVALVCLSVLAGCSSDHRARVQTLVAQADPAGSPEAPGFTALATPTLDPIASGPMGTWTAIAQTIAPPTPDPRQYEIVLRGRPHFIEFHAWW